MSLDTMNQGISDQISDIQQNIHRTYITYEAKLQQSKERGLEEIQEKLMSTKKLLEEKVKWGSNTVERQNKELVQKTVTKLEERVHQSENVASNKMTKIMDTLNKQFEGMEMKAMESCKKIEEKTNSNFSKHMDQQKSNILSDI